jgi:hypothetical protein
MRKRFVAGAAAALLVLAATPASAQDNGPGFDYVGDAEAIGFTVGGQGMGMSEALEASVAEAVVQSIATTTDCEARFIACAVATGFTDAAAAEAKSEEGGSSSTDSAAPPQPPSQLQPLLTASGGEAQAATTPQPSAAADAEGVDLSITATGTLAEEIPIDQLTGPLTDALGPIAENDTSGITQSLIDAINAVADGAPLATLDSKGPSQADAVEDGAVTASGDTPRFTLSILPMTSTAEDGDSGGDSSSDDGGGGGTPLPTSSEATPTSSEAIPTSSEALPLDAAPETTDEPSATESSDSGQSPTDSASGENSEAPAGDEPSNGASASPSPLQSSTSGDAVSARVLRPAASLGGDGARLAQDAGPLQPIIDQIESSLPGPDGGGDGTADLPDAFITVVAGESQATAETDGNTGTASASAGQVTVQFLGQDPVTIPEGESRCAAGGDSPMEPLDVCISVGGSRTTEDGAGAAAQAAGVSVQLFAGSGGGGGAPSGSGSGGGGSQLGAAGASALAGVTPAAALGGDGAQLAQSESGSELETGQPEPTFELTAAGAEAAVNARTPAPEQEGAVQATQPQESEPLPETGANVALPALALLAAGALGTQAVRRRRGQV